MPHCPFCGTEVEEESIYCLNCGKKIPERAAALKVAAPSRPGYVPGSPDQAYPLPFYQPQPYMPMMKAPCVERLVGACIDSFISQFCPCYGCFKDGIRDGQSFGRSAVNLRVIDFHTGRPATIGQSVVRNCIGGCFDGCSCYLAVLLDKDGRRIGDHLAGTVVIIDR